MENERIIGRYTGQKKGPLLLCIGGIHGNEPAGVQALSILFKLLEIEPESNPGFHFCGRIVGLRGNLRAIKKNARYQERDLNRLITPENVKRVKQTPDARLRPEELELKELVNTIEAEVDDYQPERLVVLDLHTTTAFGGIFSIATDDPESVRIAVELHAPVITGMLNGIRGTTLHYFTREQFGRDCVCVVFESGQHEETLSVNRAIAAVINCMRTIGCVRAEDVENRHDALLIEYSKGLPKVLDLLYCHEITPDDHFRMMPGYRNFQYIEEGELLAHDKNGPIYAQQEGYILMPLYQPQGEDGFFIIQSLSKEVF
jgi:succinylglutamate desuccinylase